MYDSRHVWGGWGWVTAARSEGNKRMLLPASRLSQVSADGLEFAFEAWRRRGKSAGRREGRSAEGGSGIVLERRAEGTIF